SIQRVIAVVSITPKFSDIDCIYVTLSYLIASSYFLGSLLYTPSTFLASNITSASISTALKAAAESVVKYGLPIPQPNITTLPFSKCLVALLLIYGSAICFISIAVITL